MADSTPPMLANLDKTLELYFVKKAPALPANVKDMLVSFAPWVTLILAVLSLPFILMAFGLGAFYPFMMGVGAANYGSTYYIIVALSAISIVLDLMAVPGLMNRQMRGWRFAYYGFLVSLLASLARFDIVGFIISALIGFYLLFQVKSYYK